MNTLDSLSDADLAAVIIAEVSGLEAQGVRLPAGWRDVQPMTLEYLDGVLTIARAEVVRQLGGAGCQ